MKKDIDRKWAEITKINKETDELYHKIALHYNLSDSAFWVMYMLYDAQKPCTQIEICDNWFFNKQTINSAIKNLEKAGYIQRGFVENGKLNKKIKLTDLGIKFAEETIKKIIEIEDKVYSKVNEDDLNVVLTTLRDPLYKLKEEIDKIINES